MAGFWSRLLKSDASSPAPSRVVSTDGPIDDSLRDPVTGLYNRRHLFHRLAAHIARCERSRERMAVITWDIDGFIDFNNRFGQEEGNRFLKKVADVVRGSLRSYDEAFRSGGDDFCAILIPGDEATAQEVTARVRQAVSQGLFQGKAEYADRQFSISSGVAFYPGQSVVPEALLHEAGQDLYRNRIKPAMKP